MRRGLPVGARARALDGSLVGLVAVGLVACSGRVTDGSRIEDPGNGPDAAVEDASAGGSSGSGGAGGAGGASGSGGGGVSGRVREAGVPTDARRDAAPDGISPCEDAACRPIVLARSVPALLALRGDYVYWAGFTGSVSVAGVVERVKKTGGPVATVSTIGGIRAFAVDDDYVYVGGGTFSKDAGANDGFFAIPVNGGTAIRLSATGAHRRRR